MKSKDKIETYVFIMGQSFPRSELIKLALIALLVLLMLAAGGVYLYLDWKTGVEQRIAQAEELQELEAEAAIEAADQNPLIAFFDFYLEQTNFDEIDSIRAVGPYRVGEVEMELTFLAKRPGLYRQSLSRGPLLIEFGYDGDTVWFSQSRDVVNSSDPDLMNLNKALATLESSIPTLAWEYNPQDPSDQFERMPDVVWQEHECFMIKNTGLLEGGIPVYHYIDKGTGFERYRRASVQISPKRFKDVELFYDPPLEGSEYPVPGGMELYLDGRLYYNVDFESIRVNQGIASYLFEQ